MKRVLVTGCSGFVGRGFCEALRNSGYVVRGALRAGSTVPPGVAEPIIVGDIRRDTQWSAALEDVDLIVHLAAKAHILKASPENAAIYTEANALGTQRLVAAASGAGVRRFVYMSSVKVNGEETAAHPFTPSDEPNPQDSYGLSKLSGEKAVLEGARTSGMETVIVRSPLVYGPEVRANFAQMMRWVRRGWPLPLGGVVNARSLVSIWNLSDLLLRVLDHPEAVSRTFMVSDGVDLSTPELLRLIGRSLGRPARLVPVPLGMLRLAAGLFGAAPQLGKLCGSLQVDISETRRLLDWVPPVSIQESMARTAAAFLAMRPGV
jgi:nucleoside-diphosphate-sugar epimerase